MLLQRADTGPSTTNIPCMPSSIEHGEEPLESCSDSALPLNPLTQFADSRINSNKHRLVML